MDIIGKWNWVNTNGGIGNNIYKTAQSTGKNIQITLTENYTYLVTENNQKIVESVYRITNKKSIYSGKIEKFIELKNLNLSEIVSKGILKIDDGTTLTISDNNYDGLGSTFKKE